MMKESSPLAKGGCTHERLLLTLSFFLAFTFDAAAIQIDITDGFGQLTGPTTMRVNNVLSLGDYYWPDLEWDSTSNTFQVTNIGPMNCASMEGLRNLHCDWGYVGSSARVSIQFMGDGPGADPSRFDIFRQLLGVLL